MSSEPPGALEDVRRRGILFVISAPSGAGKSTLTKLLLAAVHGIEYSISTTTRPIRPGETDGADYHFTDVETFKRLIADGAFLEHAYVHGNYYGTRRESVEATLQSGTDLLLDIDIQGARQIRRHVRPDHGSSAEARGAPERPFDFPLTAIFVFIMPPSMKALEARLRRRRTESEEAIRRRLKNAEEEMQSAKEYDYVLVNDDVEATSARLAEIIKVERTRAIGKAIRAQAGREEHREERR